MCRCVWCEICYDEKESTASERVKTAVCSWECEDSFNAWVNKPLEFIDE